MHVFFFAPSGVLFTREKTIPQLNETVKHDKIREEPEHRVLLYSIYVDVRSCFRHLLLFLLDFVPHTWQFVVYISFRLQKLNRKIAYSVYVHVRSCFWHLLLFMLKFPSDSWQLVVYISFRLQKLNRKIAYCCIR